jgi:hypothetical protein
MSVQPSGVFGQPSASAIGRAIAITSGLRMNGLPSPTIAGWPRPDSRWLRT